MFLVRIEIFGRRVDVVLIGTEAVGADVRYGILFAISPQEFLLHGFRESIDGVAGLGSARRARELELIETCRHGAFAADKLDAERFVGSSALEVYFKLDGEAGIIEQRQHYIRHVAAVFPEPQATGCKHARGTLGAGCEVEAGEQVHEQVAGDTGSIVAIIAPAEHTNRLEGSLRRAAEELIPIDSGGRCIGSA